MLWRRSSARTRASKQLGIAKRDAGHVIGTRIERTQDARRRLAARAHPQDTHTRRARCKLSSAQRTQYIEAAVRRAAEDDQIGLAGFAALSHRAWVAGAMDPVAVKLKLTSKRGIRALLAIHEQHVRTAARSRKRVGMLLLDLGQPFLPAPRKGRAHEHGSMTVRS
jgi:hypothetical protein